ncbi:glycosyltransferase [Baekduia alba]|nr:glycosyltransferase [Baekduia alba]
MFEPTAAAYYRGVYPLEAMERRGHEIVWPHDDSGDPKLDELEACDAVFVFRRSEDHLRRSLKRLSERGVAIVWDTDDDLSAIPKHSPTYKNVGALKGQRRFADTVRMARTADVMTTTTDTIRAKYERNGVTNIAVIENCLNRRSWRRSQRHSGIVIGWIAGVEHTEDLVQLRLRDVLANVVSAHPNVRVESVGVDIGLPERYTRQPVAHFDDLPKHMARYDIGLAPLCDILFNNARSNIKLKEYAASGVAWLASPRKPYQGFGEKHGGLLVEDCDWEQAIERLVRDKKLRKKLGRNGKAWALSQTIDAAADQWEQVFETAVKRATLARSAAV